LPWLSALFEYAMLRMTALAFSVVRACHDANVGSAFLLFSFGQEVQKAAARLTSWRYQTTLKAKAVIASRACSSSDKPTHVGHPIRHFWFSWTQSTSAGRSSILVSLAVVVFAAITRGWAVNYTRFYRTLRKYRTYERFWTPTFPISMSKSPESILKGLDVKNAISHCD